jgi:Uma2 family endonuclease
MIQVTSGTLTVDQFIAQYGDDKRYELIDGELFDMDPTGPHEQIVAFVGRKLNVEIDRLNQAWFVLHHCLVKPLGQATAFRPDVIVLDQEALSLEPLWQSEPVITLGKTIKLVVEVVSTNWQNDYARKVEDYATIGIQEYWIVDYAALGGMDFIGDPEQPTVSVYTLQGRRYSVKKYRGSDRILSPTFPSLQLTAQKVLQSATFF